MKNYYARIEENCMDTQVKEVQKVMMDGKLKKVKEHLHKWQQKI